MRKQILSVVIAAAMGSFANADSRRELQTPAALKNVPRTLATAKPPAPGELVKRATKQRIAAVEQQLPGQLARLQALENEPESKLTEVMIETQKMQIAAMQKELTGRRSFLRILDR